MLLSSFCFVVFVFSIASSTSTNRLPFQTSSASYTCDPYLDCQIGGIGTFVPDPDDCHNYFLCVDSVGEPVPSDIPISCPSGEYFDHITGNCILESTPCKKECYKFCNLECEVDYQLVVYPGDCRKYYLCFTGETKVEMECPRNNPYFNGTACTDNQYQCCDSCIPYCTKSSIEIEDPFDCRSFYICVETGIPSEDYHGKCPDGEHFDSEVSICVNGAWCTSLCADTLTTTTITTTSSSTKTINTGTTTLVVTGPPPPL